MPCAMCGALKVKMVGMELAIKRLNKELREARSTDPMTGLASKSKMYQAIDHHLALRKRKKGLDMSLIFFDLDGFKAVNDRDHLLGDSLIIEFANILRTFVRECDIVARFGGDEFFILAVDTDYQQAEKLVDKIRGVLTKHVSAHCAWYRFEASVGIASTSEGLDQTICLVRASDKRMLEEKRLKKKKP